MLLKLLTDKKLDMCMSHNIIRKRSDKGEKGKA